LSALAAGITKASVENKKLKDFKLTFRYFVTAIGFALNTPHDWLKRLAPLFFIQSEVKPKRIFNHSPERFPALRVSL